MGHIPIRLRLRQARRSRPVTQFRPVSGNLLQLFTDGDEAFEAAFDAMRTARHRVWLETYIFEPDEVGNMARDALAEAAERGCSVILLFDRWGSPKIDEEYVRSIIEAGGRAAVFNPVFPWRKIGRKLAPVMYRDHRKILIADDVGFCGGANVSRDYGGPGPEVFFDMTLQIEGPVVQDLAAVFLETLSAAAGEPPPLPKRSRAYEDGCPAQVLSLSRRQGRRDLDDVLENVLSTSTEQCFVMTPYFVPPKWFTQGLIRAAARGVDVRILTAGRSDVPLARVAGRHLYKKLLAAGIRVFEMQDPILHAKSMTIDSRYSIVGSYNVDEYGSKHNLEVAVASPDPDLARQIADEFEQRAAASEEMRLDAWLMRPFHVRLGEWLLHLLFRL